MPEYCVEADTLDSGHIAASEAIHRHINDSLVGLRSGGVVTKAKLKRFQTVFTAIELSAGDGMPISDNSAGFIATGTNHINLYHR